MTSASKGREQRSDLSAFFQCETEVRRREAGWPEVRVRSGAWRGRPDGTGAGASGAGGAVVSEGWL